MVDFAQRRARLHTPQALGLLAMASDHLDWDDLRYFLAAARAKTLAGAARELAVEHTTVGRRLTALERALGAALVLRGSDGLRLTRVGEQLATRVQELERGVQQLRELVVAEGGRVRLAVPSGFTRYFTAGLAQFCREHPGLTLEILSGSEVVDLASGEADLALRSGPITNRELVARKLVDVGFYLYASDAYVSRHGASPDPSDLQGHELIAYHESLARVPAAQWIAVHAAQATVVLRGRELSEMVTAAVAGVGLAVLPCSLADEEPALRRITRQPVASRPLSLVYRREARLSKHTRATIRFVVDLVTQNASRISGQ
jgi:DNA-binding transcriptional LysR family regulator